MGAPTRAEVRAVGGGALVFGTVFLDRLAPLYLVVVIRDDQALAPGALAMLPLVIGLGWAAAMAVGRVTSGRLSDRTRIALGAGGAALVHLASAFAGPWWAFLLLRFVGGLFAGTVAPPVTGLVFAWAPPRRRGLDAGIMFSATRLLGSLAAPVLVLAIAVRVDWRTALAVSALLLAVATLAFVVIAPRAPRVATGDRLARRQQARTVLAPHGRRNVALATVFGILLAAWLTVVSQTGPSVVVDALGVSADHAGAIVGAFGIGGWLAALAIPALSDRVGRRGAVACATGLGGVAAVALPVVLGRGDGVAAWVPAVLFAVGGIALGALPLALSVIPGEAVLRGDPGGAVAWPVFGAELVGAAILPAVALLGLLPEATSFVVAGVALLVGAGLTIALVTPPRDDRDDAERAAVTAASDA